LQYTFIKWWNKGILQTIQERQSESWCTTTFSVTLTGCHTPIRSQQTASYYNNQGYGNWVTQVNISHWLKDQDKMQSHISEGGINPTTCHTCSVKHPELEAALALWVQQQEAKLLTIKGPLIIEKAERIAKRLNAEGVKFSDGWLAAFKERHMLQDQRKYGQAGSAKVADAAAE
jgi:hypothetical protein